MTTVNEEYNVLPQYKDLKGILYFTNQCAYKVLSYTFHEDLKELTFDNYEPGIEGGEMYLLNVVTGLVEEYTLWINDVDEDKDISFYVCLPTKEDSEDGDELEDFLLYDFNIYYSSEHKCEPSQDLFVREFCNELVPETYYFINNPHEYPIKFEDAKNSYLPTHFSINKNATSNVVGKLYLNRISFNTHRMQLEILKDTYGALYVLAAACNCDSPNDNCNCECKLHKIFLSDLNLNQISQYIK